MRFRYFDGDGTEVQLSSVDALEFRVKTGAVTPQTLLYDAAVGHWAPAEDHPIYCFLTEEGAEPPPEMPGGSDAGAPPAPPSSSDPRPVDRGAAGGDVPDLSFLSAGTDEDAPEAEGSPAGAAPAPATDRPVEEAEGRRPGPDRSVEGLTGPEPLEEVPPAPAPDRGDPAAAPGTDDTTLRRAPSRGWGVRVDEVEIPAPLVSRSELAGPEPESRTGGRLRGTVAAGAAAVATGLATAVRWIATLALIAAVPAGVVLGLRYVDTDAMLDGVELPRVEALRAAAFGGGNPEPADADGAAASTADPDESVPDASEEPPVATGGAATAVTVSEEVESLVPRVTAAASADLADAMRDLQRALGVAETPPDPWLDGVYLAGAGRYPDVGTYWRNYGRWVAAVESMEEELFRGFVRDRVFRSGLDAAGAAALSARVLERYDRTARQRELVYRDLGALADEALALHRTLVRHERAISYEPFSGRELSRDPVIEAVPDDPALAREIWSRLDRIFDILERVQGIRPVSTLRLQEALLGGLTVPERGR